MKYEYVVNRIAEYKDDIYSLVLKGSRLDENTLDYWSDTDLVCVMKDNISITESYVQSFLTEFGEIVASERYMNGSSFLIRGIYIYKNNIEEWDILLVNRKNLDETQTFPDQSSVIYGENLELIYDRTNNSFEHNYDHGLIESIWYKLYASVKRFSRGDNLIGMHLLLDVYRELLVVKMVDRDIQKKTNIHRFGEDEDLKDLPSLKDIQLESKEIISYVLEVGQTFDTMMRERFDEYKGRFSTFEKHCCESIAELLDK